MSSIELKNISKIYGKDESQTIALDDINLEIDSGEMVAIMGPSGSGKSTLLNIIGCMDIPTSGEYYLMGKLIKNLPNRELSSIRNTVISFVFQHFALMKDYNIYDNVELPLTYKKLSLRKRRELVMNGLSQLKIENQAYKKPSELSGGQQQRAAIARALVSEASIILADEPTGALDQTTGEALMELFKKINEQGKTVVIITHDPKVASYCKRRISIRDGKITEDILL
jgi:putative ABC transport system ATP-binding protein